MVARIHPHPRTVDPNALQPSGGFVDGTRPEYGDGRTATDVTG